jgi:hypothetical protein
MQPPEYPDQIRGALLPNRLLKSQQTISTILRRSMVSKFILAMSDMRKRHNKFPCTNILHAIPE